jgi:phage shock protein PspC (stress-responsive transcriptional regulator)
MTDEAAESRGSDTTGAGSPQRQDNAAFSDEPTAHIPPPDDPPPAANPPPVADPPPPAAEAPPPAAEAPPWFGATGPVFTRERLIRPAQGRYVAGVCAAIGRATNTDPVLWRVLLVVLGLFGGVGVLIYLLGWIGIAGEGDTASPIEGLLGRGRSRMAPLSVVLLGAAAIMCFAFIVHDGFRATLLGGAVLLGVALLIRRNTGNNAMPATPAAPPPPPPAGGRSGAGFPFVPMDHTAAFATSGAPAAAPASGAPTAPGDPATATAPAGEPLTQPLPPRPPGYQPPFTAPQFGAGQFTAPQFTAPPPDDYRQPFAPHGPYAGRQMPAPARPPKPPKPPRQRSKLGRITFFALLMVLGVLALVDVAGASVPVPGYFAAALATIGLGLLVGTWFGRSRGLIALALVTALGLGVSTGVESFGGQVANNNYRPQTLAQVADRYDSKVGSMTLDLRAVDFTKAVQDTTITMDVGQIKVLLPEKVDTTAAITMDNGRAVVFGHDYNGSEVDSMNFTDAGTDGTGGGTLRLTIQVKAGNVEVSR